MKQNNKWEREHIIRPFDDTDLSILHRMIGDTIGASYSGIYPVRAVQFFKDYHSEKKIMKRSQAGESQYLNYWPGRKTLTS